VSQAAIEATIREELRIVAALSLDLRARPFHCVAADPVCNLDAGFLLSSLFISLPGQKVVKNWRGDAHRLWV
jgi:hypothetical protein